MAILGNAVKGSIVDRENGKVLSQEQIKEIQRVELGEQVHFSMGSEKNIKLTTVEDIDIFKALLLAKRSDWLK